MPKKNAPKSASITTLVAQTKRASDADRRRVEELLALVDRRKARIVEDFFDIGVALREIEHKKLYVAIGFASFAKMLAARNLMGLTQASKLIAIAGAYSRDQALALGLEKAYQLVRYSEATPAPDNPGFLLATHAKIGKKPVEAASLRELVEATRAVRAKNHPKRVEPAEHEATRAGRALQAALRKRGVKSAKATHVRVGKSWVLRVEIAVSDARALGD